MSWPIGEIGQIDCEFFGVVSVAFSAHILLLCLPAPNTRLISYFFRQVRGIPLCYWLLVLAFKNLESRHHASIVREWYYTIGR